MNFVRGFVLGLLNPPEEGNNLL